MLYSLIALLLGATSAATYTALESDSVALTTNALLAQKSDLVFNNLNTLAAPINSGTLRGLFTTTPERIGQLPELLPNARKVGLRDMPHFQGWTALSKNSKWRTGNARMVAHSALHTIDGPTKFAWNQSDFYEQLIVSLGPQK